MTSDIAAADLTHLYALRRARDHARTVFFGHRDPEGLCEAETEAWVLEHEAYALLLKAAQIRLVAEATLQELLVLEALDG